MTDERIVANLGRSTIGGDIEIDLRDAIDQYELVERECQTQCGTGEAIEGRWRGIELVDLLDGIDASATHLLVESEDGFRVCIPLVDVLDGIVAVERLDSESSPEALPRLIAPSLTGTRLVRQVASIEGEQLSPAADPGEYEHLSPGKTA